MNEREDRMAPKQVHNSLMSIPLPSRVREIYYSPVGRVAEADLEATVDQIRKLQDQVVRYKTALEVISVDATGVGVPVCPCQDFAKIALDMDDDQPLYKPNAPSPLLQPDEEREYDRRVEQLIAKAKCEDCHPLHGSTPVCEKHPDQLPE